MQQRQRGTALHRVMGDDFVDLFKRFWFEIHRAEVAGSG
jgi:hypothetical protein